jgi:hypothetical protein
MSSEVFEEMHKALRKYKEHNSVDLLHPGSAMLYGKKYIAQNKVLILPKGQNSRQGYIDFDVPFENGHRVNFHTDLHHEYNGHPILVQKNMYPETLIHGNGPTFHSYSQAPVETEEAEIKSLIDVDPEKFHKELSDLSQKPTKGFIHSSATGWNHMNEDNLQDFHRHQSKQQRELHNNETELFGPGEYPNRLLVNSGRDWYHYNIKTEQLRNIGS